MPKIVRKNRKQNRRRRRGVECVEVAVTLPLLFIICFATMQVCHRIHVSKMLYLATYEAIRAGGSPNGNEALARAIFQDRANAFGISGAELHLSNGFDTASPGARLAARATAPASENSLPVPLQFTLSSEVHGGKLIYHKEAAMPGS